MEKKLYLYVSVTAIRELTCHYVITQGHTMLVIFQSSVDHRRLLITLGVRSVYSASVDWMDVRHRHLGPSHRRWLIYDTKVGQLSTFILSAVRRP